MTSRYFIIVDVAGQFPIRSKQFDDRASANYVLGIIRSAYPEHDNWIMECRSDDKVIIHKDVEIGASA